MDEHEADGWLARLTGGDTRRPNAINPLGPDSGDVLKAVEAFGGLYKRAGLRQIVRVPDFCVEADRSLAAAGYAIEGTTRTIAANLSHHSRREEAGVELTSGPTPEWIAARVGSQGDPATEALLARLAIPAIFATVKRHGEVAAIGYVVLDEGFCIVESIRTAPAFQRQGLGTICVGALMAAAAQAGAKTACLQVDAANVAGLALYAGLGFDRHLYGYHYRVPA